MLFLEPNPTPYDLRWRMFGVPVRVHPMFWLVSLIMGWGAIDLGFQYVLIWVACVFVSILIHEFGHVAMGAMFGARGHIVLYGFGGLAIGSNHLALRRERIAVCFAGPLAGFLFLGALFVLLWLSNPEAFPAYLELAKWNLGWQPTEEVRAHWGQIVLQNPIRFYLVNDLIFINLLWGLVNLLPVWPLDGGQISRDVCEGLAPERGLNLSLGISLVVAGLIALQAILAMSGQALWPYFASPYVAFLFGLLAVQSFLLLQQAQGRKRWIDDHWDRGDW